VGFNGSILIIEGTADELLRIRKPFFLPEEYNLKSLH
jgi:hypothetical protein